MAMRALLLLFIGSVFVCACGQPATPVALGTLERDRLQLKATAAEIITALPIAEGQPVTEGQILAACRT